MCVCVCGWGGGVGRTSPGTAAVGDRSALHSRNEGRLEVKQVTGEVWHAVGKKDISSRVIYSNTTTEIVYIL